MFSLYFTYFQGRRFVDGGWYVDTSVLPFSMIFIVHNEPEVRASECFRAFSHKAGTSVFDTG
jgi:hypothetical protein